MRLKGKVAIITGGANGIGLAAVKRFLDEGATVVAVDLNIENTEEIQAQLNSPELSFMQADVTNRENIDAIVKAVTDRYGKIDILINNAGITRDATLKNLTEENYDAVMNVNAKAVFQFTQAVAPVMIAAGGGSIINTASVVGVYGNFGQTNYAASKAAVIGMTKTWSKELGKKNIRVNAVAPGFIKTSMVEDIPAEKVMMMKFIIALGDLGEAEDIANAYVFLASNESKYISGHVLHVDGGMF